MKIFPLGFRTKIALWSAAASGVAVLGFSATSAFIVFDNMMEEADVEVRRAANAVVAAAVAGDLSAAVVPGEAMVSAEPAELRLVELLGRSGEAVVDETGRWTGAEEARYGERPAFRTVRVSGESWRVVAVRDPASRIRAKLAIGIGEITLEVTRMVETYLLALPAAMALAALGGWWVAGRAAKPIRAIAEAAERISAERFERRVPVQEVSDEISRLASVLNEMIGRLEVSYGQAQRFSSDASHELRTPIAVLQGKIEEALQRAEGGGAETLADLGEQVGRLKAIVESLLMFSRADGGELKMAKERVDMGDLLGEVREDLEGIAEPAGVRAEISAEAGLWVKGDRRLLRMAVFNLLQNAVKYNRAEGGEVRCGARMDGGFVRVVVKNTGEPILKESREAIFERFFRGDGPVRAGILGMGLGLSLARVVARAHGGDVRYLGSEGGWNVFEMEVAGDLGGAES